MQLDEYIKDREERDPAFRHARKESQPHFDLRRSVIAARLNASMTQQELSKASGLPRSTITRLESGESNPTVATLEKLAAALSIRFAIDGQGTAVIDPKGEPLPAD